jgi:ADP-ribose pyrophosphatase YjhB (NUDIX family)
MIKSVLTWLYGKLPLTRRMRTALIWLLSPKFVVGVVGLVCDDEGRVLLLKHTYRRRNPWGLPGGGLTPGESLEECLKREIREETGMEVVVEKMLSAGAHPDRRLVDAIFACKLRPGESLASFRPNTEISEARFFPPDRLPKEVSWGLRQLLDVALRQARGEQISFTREPDLWP